MEQKVRSEKELWQVVLDNQQEFCNGICLWIVFLEIEGIITTKEHDVLLMSIKNLNPILKKSDIYLWECSKIQPRIEWIENRIKQLEKWEQQKH